MRHEFEQMLAEDEALGVYQSGQRGGGTDEEHGWSPAGTVVTTLGVHVTHIERDGAGQWGWVCACLAEATGFELAQEVLDAAMAHGPLAANSLIPTDEEE